MFTVVDFNNFWSPSGGGVRRYHLQKMEFYKQQKDVLLVFVMPDGKTYTEQVSDSLIIEHVEAYRFPGNWEYRFMWRQSQIQPVLKKYMPQVIEVGSPYILPTVVRHAAKKICPKAALLSFWHADFPVTYVGRPVANKLGKALGSVAEKIAFWYARREFTRFDAVEVSCKEVMERLERNHLPHPYWVPLGCDIRMFSPEKHDATLAADFKGGNSDRLTIFFPHRFCEEKGIELLLGAYDELTAELGVEPELILAGTGPYLPQVQEAVKTHPHIRYVGFIKSIDEMARHYASFDLGLALSGWETFGLSILESMASGNAQIGAATGAACEHVKESGAGIILEERTPHALAQAIIKLYKSDLTDKKLKARQYAEKFSWNDCFKRQLDLYKEISTNKNN